MPPRYQSTVQGHPSGMICFSLTALFSCRNLLGQASKPWSLYPSHRQRLVRATIAVALTGIVKQSTRMIFRSAARRRSMRLQLQLSMAGQVAASLLFLLVGSSQENILHGSLIKDSPISGDHQGIGYVINAMNIDGPSRPQHYLVPRRTASLLQPDDLVYLKAKGCFSLPNEDISDSLIKCYFKYTHPMFPIIDLKDFWRTYTTRGLEGCNLLLLWSMFSVAGSVSEGPSYENLTNRVKFIEDKSLDLTGYKTRKELKRSLYERAKVYSPMFLRATSQPLWYCFVIHHI